MVNIVCDMEANALLEEVTRLHSIQIGDADGTDAIVYADWPGCRPIPEGLERLRAADRIIGHNFLTYDYPMLEKFHPGVIQRSKIFDTLVASRLAFPQERDHRLATWGKKLGVLKGEFKGPWDTLTQEMVDYAQNDVIVGRAIWNHTKHVLDWGMASQVEHKVAWRCFEVEQSGWGFNVKLAQELEMELRAELAALNAELQAAFPPIERTLDFVPKVNNKTRGYVKGEVFVRRWTEEFNVNSGAHIAERLQMKGWRPKSYGDDGVPTTSEKVLATLPYPEVKLLLRSTRLVKQIGMLSDGKQGWLKCVRPSGRIHHRINSCGAVTQRMTHSSPNLAQADKKDERMRALFEARPGWTMVGADAEGCQLRMLAHYLARWDNGELADRLVNGDKKKGTDCHTVNLKSLHRAGVMVLPKGYTSEMVKEGREGAKTTTYALLFGSGDYALGETAKNACRDAGIIVPKIPSKELGLLTRKALAISMVGSDKLVEMIKARVAQKGFLIGLDGRHLAIRHEHAGLNTLLQAGEAVAMKFAINLFGDWLDERYTRNVDYAVVGYIHDEIQLECRPELAPILGQKFADCIRDAGVALGVRCALAGSWSQGPNWSCTH